MPLPIKIVTDGDVGCIDEVNNAVRVNIVSGAGSGGTSMTDDAAFTPGTGGITPAGAIYRSVRDAVDDNDAGALAMTQKRALLMSVETPNADSAMDDVNDALRVNVVAGAAGGYGGQADESAFTEGTTTISVCGGVLNDTITSNPTEDQAAALRITPFRAVHTHLRNVGGTEIATLATPVRVDPTGTTAQPITDNAGSITVDGTVAVSGTVTVATHDVGSITTAVVPGTGATNLGKAIDAVAGATDTGVVSLAVRDDALSALTPVEGDYVPHRVDANGALWVHDDALDAAISGSELQVDVVAALPTGTNNIGDVDVLTLPALPAGTNNIGDVDVLTLPALPAGTNNIGDIDVLSVVPGTGATNLGKAEDAAHVSADTGVYALAVRDDAPAAHSGTDGDYESLHVSAEGGLWSTLTPSASGGLSIHRSLDLDESEEEVKATAGTLYGWYIFNASTSIRYLKFYNDTAANVVVGTTTPVMTIPIPAQSSGGVGANVLGAVGIAFSVAICAAVTTALADADTGAPSTNDVVVNFFYK